MQYYNQLGHRCNLMQLIHIMFKFQRIVRMCTNKKMYFTNLTQSPRQPPTPAASAPPLPASSPPTSTSSQPWSTLTTPQHPFHDPRLPILHLPSYEEAVNMDWEQDSKAPPNDWWGSRRQIPFCKCKHIPKTFCFKWFSTNLSCDNSFCLQM